jgi:hypothetical protein
METASPPPGRREGIATDRDRRETTMKLRQVVLAADALEPARTILFDLFGIENAFVDPGVAAFGLTNSVMSIGDGFLEIVAPVEDGTAAGRLLERRGGTCGYMLIFQVEDFEATSGHLDALGVRKVWSFANDAVSACHVHPKDIGGAIVSFDEMRPPADWVWGGPHWREQRAADAKKVLGCTLESPAAEGLAARWALALDRPVTPLGGGWKIDLDDGTFLEFVAGVGANGIRGFTFAVDDAAALREKAASLGLSGERPLLGDLELTLVQAG